MRISLRRTAFKTAAAFGCLLVGGTALTIGVTAATADASGTTAPPWEPDASSVGGLLLYNAVGQQVTGGNVTDSPIAAYIQGASTIQSGDTKATLYGYTPVSGEAPGAWTGFQLTTASAYPNAGAPSPLNTSPLPLVTGVSGVGSVAQLIADDPNTDSSTDGYAGLYVLRLKTIDPGVSPATTYDSADIEVTGSGSTATWSVVYPAITLTSTTTTLATSPPSPQVSGTSVTLTATVSPSAPGTVQFEYGTGTPTLIGSPVTVSGGTASTSTTALPVGADSVSAVFTPAAFSAYSGSTGTGSYTITSSSQTSTTTTLTTSPASPQKSGTSVTLKATVSPSAPGTVQFEVASTDIGTPVTVSGGTASISTTTLPVGTDSLSAVFVATAGSGFAGSTGTASFTVTAAKQTKTKTKLATSPKSPQVPGTSVKLTATVSPSAAPGTVQFKVGTTDIGTPVTVSGGTASVSTSSLPVGHDKLEAIFTPTSGSAYGGSTGKKSFTIKAKKSKKKAGSIAVRESKAVTVHRGHRR